MNNKAFRVSSWILALGILNFFLFVAVSLVIGGDALNGGVDNGQYYLGGGGRHTPVPYLVFLYSKVHAYSVFISWPILMVIGLVSLVYWPQGSGFVFGVNPDEPKPGNVLQGLARTVRAAVWRIIDLLEGIAWLILDSWRRPDVEFFTSYSRGECLSRLRLMVNSTGEPPKSPVFAQLSGTHIRLMRTPRRSTILFYRGPFPTLNIRLVGTSHGTYIRAWHRFPSPDIFIHGLLFSVFIGLLAPILGRYLLFPDALVGLSDLGWAAFLLLTVVLADASGTLLSLYIGAQIGKRRSLYLSELLAEALEGQA